MKISVVSVIVFVGGFILVYAGIKDVDPRDVVKAALRGENPGDLPPRSPKVTQSDTAASGGVVKLPNAKGRDPKITKLPNADATDPTPLTGGGDVRST